MNQEKIEEDERDPDVAYPVLAGLGFILIAGAAFIHEAVVRSNGAAGNSIVFPLYDVVAGVSFLWRKDILGMSQESLRKLSLVRVAAGAIYAIAFFSMPDGLIQLAACSGFALFLFKFQP